MPASPFAYSPATPVLVSPASVEEASALLADPVNAARPILVRGGGTKWDAGHRAFAAAASTHLLLSTAKLTGILEYDPGELTIAARAGTPLAEVEAVLAQHGQYLPFDPPFANAGATIGGTVTAGLGGPRRLRYGGLRDFVIGIEYLDANGRRVRSGGKVVKNAAGYDFSKLFCGSMGSLGVLTSVSFKVFPAPAASRTLLAALPDISAVRTAFKVLQASPAEVSAVEAWPARTVIDSVPHVPDLGASFTLAVLVEGTLDSLDGRMKAVRGLLPLAANATTEQINAPEAQRDLWRGLQDLVWIGNAPTVLKFYLPANRVVDLEAILALHGARHVYSAAGNVAWAAFEGDPARLTSALTANEISAAVWRSPVPSPDILPAPHNAAITLRVKRAFDPAGRLYSSQRSALTTVVGTE